MNVPIRDTMQLQNRILEVQIEAYELRVALSLLGSLFIRLCVSGHARLTFRCGGLLTAGRGVEQTAGVRLMFWGFNNG